MQFFRSQPATGPQGMNAKPKRKLPSWLLARLPIARKVVVPARLRVVGWLFWLIVAVVGFYLTIKLAPSLGEITKSLLGRTTELR